MKSQIIVRAVPNGYVIDYAGRFGGGGSVYVIGDAAKAAGMLRLLTARYVATNPEGGDYHAPEDVVRALEALDCAPAAKGERLSYYASPAALQAIQAQRETTGDSLSGAINALVLR